MTMGDLERRLSGDDAGETVFDAEALTRRLEGLDGLTVPASPRADRLGRHGGARPSLLPVIAGMAAVLAIAVGLVGVVPVLRGDTSLPGSVRDRGQLRMVVTERAPQLVRGGTLQGFDVDVARAIAARLGIAVQVDAVDPAVIEAGGWAPTWDAAIDSTILQNDQLLRGTPIWWRSGAVVVREGGPIAGSADLAGHPVCVVTGSVADRWLAGGLLAGTLLRVVVPPAASVQRASSADACLDSVMTGTADAYVADWGYDVSPPGPGLRVLTDPPFSVGVRPAVDVQRQDARAVADALESAVSQLRADGTLRQASERRFGGLDLTAAPP